MKTAGVKIKNPTPDGNPVSGHNELERLLSNAMNLQLNSNPDQAKNEGAAPSSDEAVQNALRAMSRDELAPLLSEVLKANEVVRLTFTKQREKFDGTYDSLSRVIKNRVEKLYSSKNSTQGLRESEPAPMPVPAPTPAPVQPVRSAVLEQKAASALMLVRRWPATKWGIPSLFVRSSLFAAIAKTRGRVADERVVLAAQAGGVPIRRISGAEWTQYDLSVLMLLVQMADEKGYFSFGVDDMLCKLDTVRNGSTRRALEQSLDRLCGYMRLDTSDAESKNRRKVSLLPDFTWSTRPSCGTGKKCWGRLADILIELYSTENITYIDSAQRLALPAGLAQWLHAFYSSHRDPISLQAAELAKWAGLTSSQNELNRLIRNALSALQSVGFLSAHEVSRTGVVVVERCYFEH